MRFLTKTVETLIFPIFKEFVYNKSKSFLVKFYSDGIGDSDEKLAIYENLAQQYEHNKDLVFAEIDVMLNDGKEFRFFDGQSILINLRFCVFVCVTAIEIAFGGDNFASSEPIFRKSTDSGI